MWLDDELTLSGIIEQFHISIECDVTLDFIVNLVKINRFSGLIPEETLYSDVLFTVFELHAVVTLSYFRHRFPESLSCLS